MNKKQITKAGNPLLAASLPALKRSAARARQIAAQTGTHLITVPASPLRVGENASAGTVTSGLRPSKKPLGQR